MHFMSHYKLIEIGTKDVWTIGQTKHFYTTFTLIFSYNIYLK